MTKNKDQVTAANYSITKVSISYFSFKNSGGKILIPWFSDKGRYVETIELEKADYTEQCDMLG
ncbi:MAG: hypothetical protein ACI9DJ_002241 [Algoriphagus sp.]|jgi:hypothetical protein